MKIIKYILLILFLMFATLFLFRGGFQGYESWVSLIFWLMFLANTVFSLFIYRNGSARAKAFSAMLFKLLFIPLYLVMGLMTALAGLGGTLVFGLAGPFIGLAAGFIMLFDAFLFMLPTSAYSLAAQLQLIKFNNFPKWLFVLLVIANFVFVADLVSAIVSYILAKKYEEKSSLAEK